MGSCYGYSYWYEGPSSRTATRTRESKLIEVDKGSPAKAKYAIFYAVEEDPVIFVKTWAQVQKELKKLKKREEVQQKSIRVFKLV